MAIFREFGYFWHQFATKISFWLLGHLTNFLLLMKVWQNMVLNQFWIHIIVLWCIWWHFRLLKELWCRYLGFPKVLWCRSFRFSKIWLLFCLNFLAKLYWLINDQCCQIWQFVANLATFYVKLWPKICLKPVWKYFWKFH